MTLSNVRSTDELVTCDCVAIVQMPYPAPTANAAALTGTNTRSGLKIVITRSRIKPNVNPSCRNRIFDWPARFRASVGSNPTLYPALMNASVVVVGAEKPLGSKCRNSLRQVRRAARNPDVRSGIGRPVK